MYASCCWPRLSVLKPCSALIPAFAAWAVVPAGEGWTVEQFDVDFRVGGFERSRFRYQGGPPITNESVYQVIQPNERIILAYAMAIDGVPLSGSLLTMEYLPEGSGTRLVFGPTG